MKYENLIIETKAYQMLKQMIAMAHHKTDATYKASLEKFQTELKNAKILNITKMPKDVVGFNSIVTIKDPNGQKRVIEIVQPDKSNIAEQRISVLAPMGLALFGYANKDEIMWQFPSGMKAISILKVQQPVTLKKTIS